MVKGRKIKICKKLACKVSDGKTFFSDSCIDFKINFIRIDYTKQKFKAAGGSVGSLTFAAGVSVKNKLPFKSRFQNIHNWVM